MLLFTIYNNKDDFKSFLDWTSETAQQVMLLCKHEVLSLNPQNSYKARYSSVCVCNTSMPRQRLEVGTGESWEVKRLANVVLAKNK